MMATNQEDSLLARKVELLELELKKRDLEATSKPATPKPWWTTAVEFLALPAAVLAIVFQMTQTSGSLISKEKTEAETAKIRIEEIKTRVEVEKLIDELAMNRAKGAEAYQEELDQTLPKLQEAVGRLSILEKRSNKSTFEQIILKWIVLWVLFWGISLIFDIVRQAWNTMLMSIMMVIQNRRPKYDESEKMQRRWAKIRKTSEWAYAFLSPVPSVVLWSLQLSIFIILMIPLFNEISMILGSDITLNMVIESASNLEFSEALRKLHVMLFGFDT